MECTVTITHARRLVCIGQWLPLLAGHAFMTGWYEDSLEVYRTKFKRELRDVHLCGSGCFNRAIF